MVNNIIIVICFIIIWTLICKAFNYMMMKQYKKNRKVKNNVIGLSYGYYMDNIGELRLAGAGGDGNGDYDVPKAIKKTELPDDVRIRVNE